MVSYAGCDIDFSRPSGAQLRAAGKQFAVCYLFPPGGGSKGITAAEIDDFRRHGVWTVFVYEQWASSALNGYNQGVSHATYARDRAHQLQVPADRPIYFAVDFDMTVGQQFAVGAYFNGVASVLGRWRTGIYGGLRTIRASHALGWASWHWQTYAWSGGVVDKNINMYQYRNGVMLSGHAVDLDMGYNEDFGQWKGGGQGLGAAADSAPIVTSSQGFGMVTVGAWDFSPAIRSVSDWLIRTGQHFDTMATVLSHTRR